MSELFLVLSLLVFGGGATLMLVGYVFGIVTLMGTHRVWGVISMFVPIVAVVCFVIYRSHVKYPLRMFGAGLLLLMISAYAAYHFAWEYTGSIRT